MSEYKQIIELVRKSDFVLFIGAGFSLKAGAPSGRNLCDTIYDALPSNIQEEKSLKTEYTLQKLSETYEIHNGREALMTLLKNAFEFEKKDTSDQDLLACIPQFKHIITTNYDSLLEDAYSDKCNLVVTNSDLSKIDSRKPTIYKIHGDFSNPKNIIITKNDYNRLYTQQQENLIWDSIRVEFSRHNVLFIGYSISDPNIQILIEYVKKQMGDSAKRLFVLTPEVEETSLLQLKAIGVEYIAGKAEDLFNELIPALKNHIVEDYEHNTTSSEDFAQFLKIYDLIPNIELGINSPNKLLALKSASGNHIQHIVNFSMRSDGRTNPLDQIKPYYDERFGDLPVKKITDFYGFEYRANDILVQRGDNNSAIYLLPIPKKGEICISIPQSGIVQKAPCRYYNNGFDQLQIDANIDIGEFQIKVPISPSNTCGFNLKHNEKYTNNMTAIGWAEVFYAIFKGYEFSLTITSEENGESRLFTYAFKKSELKREKREAKQILQYYKYIQGIEPLLQKCFREYCNFSQENYEAAEMIYHYLKKTPVIVQHPIKGYEYVINTQDNLIQSYEKEKLFFIESFQNVTYKLNDIEITIPYIQMIFKQSILKRKKKDSNGQNILTFIDKAKNHTIQLSDKPMQIKTDEGIIDV